MYYTTSILALTHRSDWKKGNFVTTSATFGCSSSIHLRLVGNVSSISFFTTFDLGRDFSVNSTLSWSTSLLYWAVGRDSPWGWTQKRLVVVPLAAFLDGSNTSSCSPFSSREIVAFLFTPFLVFLNLLISLLLQVAYRESTMMRRE